MSTLILIGAGAIGMPSGMNRSPRHANTLRFCAAGGLICINAAVGGSGRFGHGAFDPEGAQQPRSFVMAHKRIEEP